MIRSIENFLLLFLGLAAGVVFAGAILIMIDMDASSASQGGRYYVAVVALVALGAIDSQILKTYKRRLPFTLGTTPEESRYALISLLLLIAAGVVLIGVAWILS